MERRSLCRTANPSEVKGVFVQNAAGKRLQQENNS